MHTVILDGDDLVDFLSFMNDTLKGAHGKISAMQLYVQDDGTLIFGTNGYTSKSIGRPNARLNIVQQDYSAAENAVARVEARSGNPYANVPDEDNEGPEDYEILKYSVFQQIDSLLPRVEKIIDNIAIKIQDG